MSRLNEVDPKDPGETKTYTMDWTSGLGSGASISASAWTVPPGLTNVSDGIVSGNLKTSVTLSGGIDGQDYELVNEITTSDGEILRQAGTLRVRTA